MAFLPMNIGARNEGDRGGGEGDSRIKVMGVKFVVWYPLGC